MLATAPDLIKFWLLTFGAEPMEPREILELAADLPELSQALKAAIPALLEDPSPGTLRRWLASVENWPIALTDAVDLSKPEIPITPIKTRTTDPKKEKRIGRPRLNHSPLTNAERVAKHRDQQRVALERAAFQAAHHLPAGTALRFARVGRRWRVIPALNYISVTCAA